MVRCAERAGNIDENLFPFHYLILAVADQKRLFSAPEKLHSRKLLAVCDSPYDPKLSIIQQRIKRICFLHELNLACCLPRDARSKNWKLFLSVHGTRIESKEEYELWKTILYPKGREEANEDIPVMELTLLCLDCLDSCLANQMATLYCYLSGSLMHQGGFSKFINQYPDVLNACTERVAQRDWAKYKRKYLREWASLECDQSAIQALCSKRATSIRWGSISAGLNQKLKDFCWMAYTEEQNRPVSSERIEASVQELKALLVEAAFRTVLGREAPLGLAE